MVHRRDDEPTTMRTRNRKEAGIHRNVVRLSGDAAATTKTRSHKLADTHHNGGPLAEDDLMVKRGIENCRLVANEPLGHQSR